MNTLFGLFEGATRSVVLLRSSRSSRHTTSRHITRYLFCHSHHYVTTSRRQPYKISAAFPHQGRRYSTTSKKTSDPLHILFCGSDDFSCAALKALHNEHVRNPDLIRSIDVVVRPGKPTGRGYKVIRDPPVRGLAGRLGLPIHERDTFTGWDMPTKTNLIIAVSFGLFVPPRLLRKAKYGGLNLHPSLLPDLRGPAPLQHTLLTGREVTGVSLQTLDHTTFDHGVVLAQTPRNPADAGALRIPPTCTTVAVLQALVTPVAAGMLIEGLRAGLHVPPYESRVQAPDPAEPLTHAPKITKRDRQLTLAILQACDAEAQLDTAPDTLARRQAAIGPLWFLSRDRQGRQKRIILEALAVPIELPPEIAEEEPMAPAEPWTHGPSMVEFRTDNDLDAEQETSSPHKRYLIPFEEEQEGGRQPQQEQAGSEQQPRMNLVFWDRVDSSEDPAPRGEDDGLWLGNYRILGLKVEGEKAKPTRQALHNFIINSTTLDRSAQASIKRGVKYVIESVAKVTGYYSKAKGV